jgi:hypothetical protein
MVRCGLQYNIFYDVFDIFNELIWWDVIESGFPLDIVRVVM